MTTRKPKPDLVIRFSGAALRPESIPMAVLARALAAIQRLALGPEAPDEDEAIPVEAQEDAETALRLITIKRGSAVFDVVAPKAQTALTNLRLVGRLLAEPSFEPGAAFPVRAIEELSAVARQLNCEIVVSIPVDGGAVLARFEPTTYERVASSMFVTGETSLIGHVTRVGGATELRCALRVPTQERLVYCGVANSELGRKLGQHLYSDVVVRGTATWLRTNWAIVGMEINGVEEPKRGSVLKALDAAWDAGANAWDNIKDPDAFLDEVTGGR